MKEKHTITIISCLLIVVQAVQLEDKFFKGLNALLTRGKRQALPPVDVDAYLEKYGYLDIIPAEASHSEETRSNAISEFQRFANLPVSGQLDKATLQKMRQRRCGMRDVIRPSERNAELRARAQNEPLAFSNTYKWDHNEITYKFLDFTRQLPESSQRRAVQNALSKWAEVTPLIFRESTGSNPDILIAYRRNDHNDGSSFDGRGGTLAHAFFPGTASISGDTHFDEDEIWTENTEKGTNLEIVSAHEFGHALGLGHSNAIGALMKPFYGGYDPNYKLGTDDVYRIQQLYGGPNRRLNPQPTQAPKPTIIPSTNNKFCDLKFDGISNAHDGSTYIFRKKEIYKLSSRGYGIEPGFPQPIKNVYKQAPNGVGAVLYSSYTRHTYIFKGNRFWRFTGYTKDSGYPKMLEGFYVDIQAALEWRDGQIYVFKKDQYSVWREDFTRPPNGYPRPIASFWGNLIPNLEAAIRWRDGITYFFRGKNYIKFNDSRRQMEAGYPKPKAAPWLGCDRPIPK
uniref:Matrix metalloproteinase 1 n=1 Tax=Sinohyriopsis cumingii TaxID=165450 RepID=A0A1Z1G774_SINCU|nr:matrix metalloproteinase 1 [Sinohyriopsis cumingii]